MTCPFCGPRDASEFRFGGDPSVARPGPECSDADWAAYIYLRDNPRGLAEEYWVHSQGCGQWLIVERDTVTHLVGKITEATP
ncbi:MAG: sarcosine oxidase subunit delta [Tabrizicola sp.]|nr:sarcosine oxidase subunit delta [Tabrizicola sp.]